MTDFTNEFYEDGFLDPLPTHSRTTFLRITGGYICSALKQPREGYERTEITNPKTREVTVLYTKRAQSITGWLIGLRSRLNETSTGSFAQMELKFVGSSGRHAVLTVSPRSTFVSRLAKSVENIDLSQPFKVIVTPDRGGAPSQYKVFFEQFGQTIKQKYTANNPQGLPEWKRNSLTGEYDDRDYWAFLHNILATYVVPQAEENARRLALGTLLPETDSTSDYDTDSPKEAVKQMAASLSTSVEAVEEAIKQLPPTEEPEFLAGIMTSDEINQVREIVSKIKKTTKQGVDVKIQKLKEEYDDDIPF